MYSKTNKIKVGHSKALRKTYFVPFGVEGVSDIAIKCVPVSKPGCDAIWIAKKRCKLVKACHQPSYNEAVVERWDELMEVDPIRHSCEELEAENDEILIQIVAQERDLTRQSSPVCDQLRTGG